jgi:hypothetical protein
MHISSEEFHRNEGDSTIGAIVFACSIHIQFSSAIYHNAGTIHRYGWLHKAFKPAYSVFV